MSTQPQTQPTPQELALAGILATLASGAVLTAPLALGAAGALGVPAAAILAAFKIAGSVPLPPMPAGQAARHASAVNVGFRVHFIAATAKRLAGGGSVAAERDNLRAHLAASQARLGAGVAVDVAEARWGPVLGWQSAGDTAVTAGCRRANRNNFDPRRPPVVEGARVLPGWLHGGQCVTGETLVQACGVRASMARGYVGEVVRLEFRSGRSLTITPNHPVLTPRGWVGAGLLQAGDDVVGGALYEGSPGDKQNDYNGPTRIEQLVKARAVADGMRAARVPVATEDFHGDGADGDVEVVWSDRFLLDDGGASREQPFRDLVLGGIGSAQALARHGSPAVFRSHDVAGLRALGEGTALALLWGAHAPPGGGVRGSGIPSMLLGGSGLHCEPVGGRQVTGFDVRLAQHAADDFAGDIVQGGELLDGSASQVVAYDRVSRELATVPGGARRWPTDNLDSAGTERAADLAVAGPRGAGRSLDALARDVEVDCVIQATRRQVARDVYNLETETGWYIAGGIVVHNCRCRPVAPFANARMLV